MATKMANATPANAVDREVPLIPQPPVLCPEVPRHPDRRLEPAFYVFPLELNERGSAGSTTAAITLAALAIALSRHTGLTHLLLSSYGPWKGSHTQQRLVFADIGDDPPFATLVERVGVDPSSNETAAGEKAKTANGPISVRHVFGDGTVPDPLMPLPHENQTTPLELEVRFCPRRTGLLGMVAYDSGLFNEAYIARLAEHIRAIVAGAGRHPDRPVSRLTLLSPAERGLLRLWGGAGIPAEVPRTVHELVEEQARHAPDLIAVGGQDRHMTYRELDSRANRLAEVLAQKGVSADRVVAVLSARSPELIVILLAILKAGGAYMALEPDTPEARLHYLLHDAAPHLVLAEREFLGRLGEVRAPVHILDENSGSDEDGQQQRSCGNVHSDSLAYVSYTSGSTGTPKGVCVPHAAVARLVRGANWASFRRDDVFLQLSPIAFDASTLEIWAPLTNGSRLAVYPPGPVLPDQLAETLRREGVTVLWLTAGLFHQMVDTHLDAFAGLRHVITGGDVVSGVHVERLLAEHRRLRFTNGYGPTENTTFTTCWTTRAPDQQRVVPIGRPITGTRVAILDRRLHPVPIGVPGELYIGGGGLARCYLRRPSETAASFVPDPIAGEPGARLYQSGDLARWREDGFIEFLGRADFQVKIQGYRVELGEVEAMLSRHRLVRDSVVITQPDGRGGKRLLAYVVLTASVEKPEDIGRELRAHLRDHLPPYMIPVAITPIDQLPLTKNGKIDRAALAAWTRPPRHLPAEHVPPRTPLETRLTELWSQILGVDLVGIHDDFFELGGHSLLAADMLQEIHRTLGVEVPARTFYLRSIVADLATAICELQTATASQECKMEARPCE